MRDIRGFTLLETLIALSLGALLLSSISSLFWPILEVTEHQAEQIGIDSSHDQALDMFENMQNISAKGLAIFPTALQRGKTQTSLAIQFSGTGEDPSSDRNGDGSNGIKGMDNSLARSVDGAISDDDRDGQTDEDPTNGIDDDFDGLIDEDPGSDSDSQMAPGIAHFDDNHDGDIDKSYSVNTAQQYKPWAPFLPTSLRSEHQPETTTVAVTHSGYSQQEDDNEDGIKNNGPVVTWSARLEDRSIICTTPMISTYEQRLSSFKYVEYRCVENVENFHVVRSYSPQGKTLFTVTLTINIDGKSTVFNKTLTFL